MKSFSFWIRFLVQFQMERPADSMRLLLRFHQLNFLVMWLLLVQSTLVESMQPEVNATQEVTKVLRRHKRYLAFPEGSSVSAAICLTIGMIGNPDVDYLSWAVNWGVAYDLPNHQWVIQHAHGLNATLAKDTIKRRSRRAFYDEVQSLFDNMGFNGRACMARALCESARFMLPSEKRGNMLQELVRTVFSLPPSPVSIDEPLEHHHYDRIYRRSKRNSRECHEIYPGCQFSLLALALGKYMAATTTKFSSINYM